MGQHGFLCRPLLEKYSITINQYNELWNQLIIPIHQKTFFLHISYLKFNLSIWNSTQEALRSHSSKLKKKREFFNDIRLVCCYDNNLHLNVKNRNNTNYNYHSNLETHVWRISFSFFGQNIPIGLCGLKTGRLYSGLYFVRISVPSYTLVSSLSTIFFLNCRSNYHTAVRNPESVNFCYLSLRICNITSLSWPLDHTSLCSDRLPQAMAKRAGNIR